MGAKYWLDLTKEDMMWSISDPGWAVNSWSSVFGPWSQGSTVFLLGGETLHPKVCPLLLLSLLCWHYKISHKS